MKVVSPPNYRYPENAQNHAQNIESGDSGDSGGILPTLEDRVYSNDGNKNIFSKRYVAFDFECLLEVKRLTWIIEQLL
jgi:hypothetical protein